MSLIDNYMRGGNYFDAIKFNETTICKAVLCKCYIEIDTNEIPYIVFPIDIQNQLKLIYFKKFQLIVKISNIG